MDLPPVRTNGAVTYSLQETKQGDGPRELQHTGTVSISPSTYLYEPWLATTAGTLNLSKVMGGGDSASDTDVITGSVSLNILPQSSFPTELVYQRFDRSVQLGDTDSNITGQTFKLTSQVFMEDDLSFHSRLTTDNSEDDEGAGEDSIEAEFEVDKRFDHDQLRAGISMRDATYAGTDLLGDGESSSQGATLRYRSHPFETVTSDSTSSFRSSTYSDKNFNEDSTVMQGVTTTQWQPAKDMTVYGALRTFRQEATLTRQNVDGTTDTTTRSAQTAYGTASTSYILQPRLVGSLGLNAGYSDIQDQTTDSDLLVDPEARKARSVQSMTMGGNGGLDYTSLASDLAGFSWTWNAGGTSAVATDSAVGLIHNQSVRVGHNGSRLVDLLLIDNVNMSLSQTLGVSVDSDLGTGTPLSHAVVFSKNNRDGKSWNLWHLSASDSRTIGGITSNYQLVNLQVTQGYDPDRFQSWTASLTWQTSRQVVGDEDSGLIDNTNGQIAHRRRNVFDVERLNFTSELSINPPSIMTRRRLQDATLSSSRYDTRSTSMLGTQRWTNRLDYGIGMLRTGLTARLVRNEQGINEMVLFQITRHF